MLPGNGRSQNPTPPGPSDAALIREHLARVSASPQFALSHRLQAFLNVLVTAFLRGDADQLKESVIATEVYGRGADFDPKLDSIVRTEASRFRRKLEEYYASGGAGDLVRFSLPKGGYAISIEVLARPEPASPTPAPPPPPPPSVSRRNLILVGALVAMAGAGYGVFRLLQPVPEPFQVTNLPGRQIQPWTSPDGARVAFAWDGEQGDNFDIYVKPIRGGGIQRLTTHEAADRSPAWSPDGTSIAFLRELPENRQAVYVVPANGGAERQVTVIQTFVAGIAWTTDSRHLIVPDTSAGLPLALFLVSLANGERSPLTGHINAFHPALSPDGRTLAFSSYGAEPAGLVTIQLMPLNASYLPAGPPVPLPETRSARAFFPSWAPDGRSLLYSNFDENSWVLFRVTPSSHRVERIRSVGTGVSKTQEIALGGLVFVRETSHFLIARVPSAESAPKSKPTPAFRTVEEDYGPALSPDGRLLAFISGRSGKLALWIANPDGSDARQIQSAAAGPGRPRWSPDSKYVVFRSQGAGSKIFRANVADRQAVMLPLDGAENTNPSVSRDGKWLYFVSTRTGRNQIWRAPFPGGSAELMSPDEAHSAEESVDGQFLYFWSLSGIHRMSLRDRASSIFWKGIPTANFTVTGDGIYYEGLSGGDVMEVRYRAFNGSAPEQVFRSEYAIQGWCIVPGQPALLMGVRRLQSNIEAYLPR